MTFKDFLKESCGYIIIVILSKKILEICEGFASLKKSVDVVIIKVHSITSWANLMIA